jgi:DNA-binding PadR family transcriptional regulator
MNDLLLLAMMLGAPKYGYQLKREAGWITGQDTLHSNIVYPMLRRFLEQKWVRRKAVAGERGQTRQQYALTAAGKGYLLDRLNQFGEADASSEEAFNLRVGNCGLLSPEMRETIFALREQYLLERDQKFARLEDNMELGTFGREIVKHMREQARMEAEWVRHLRRLVKKSEAREASGKKAYREEGNR